MCFTLNDLDEIIKIKDRVIKTLLFGGGGALSDEEKSKLKLLYKKAENDLIRTAEFE